MDLRPTSPTYGRSFGTELTADSGWQLWIPEGFAHGFLALTPGTHVHYKCTAPYSPAHEGSLRWDDPHIAIPWPLTAPPLLSPKDAAAPGWGGRLRLSGPFGLMIQGLFMSRNHHNN